MPTLTSHDRVLRQVSESTWTTQVITLAKVYGWLVQLSMTFLTPQTAS